MPNYSLILDTKFKPFSYQEMLAPVMAATQAHQALETEYGDLATKASVWERMANEQTDPYAYKMYKTYSEDLENMAEQLARSGLSPASRRNMLNMKARYSSEILPIETAYKRREELAAEQRKAIAANPTLRYQRMAGQMSLDDFIRNPSLDYGESYSGALLTQQVSQAAANFQRALTDKGQLQKLGLPYQYERMLQYGATPAQVMAAMSDNAQQGDTDAIRFLRGITDQVLQSSGVADWADPTTMREFRAFANQGLYKAIGQAKLDNFTDQFSMQDALHARQYNRQVAVSKKAQEDANRAMIEAAYGKNTSSLLSQSDVAEANQKELKETEKWQEKGYITKAGQVTKRGTEAVARLLEYEARTANNDVPDSPYYKGKVGKDSEFLDYARKHGYKPTVRIGTALDSQGRSFNTYSVEGLNDASNINAFNQAHKNMFARRDSGELVTGIANIKVNRVRTDQGKESSMRLLNLISSQANGVKEVGRITKSGTLTEGSPISLNDLKKKVEKGGVVISHLGNNPAGDQLFMELSDGTKYIMPESILGDEFIEDIHTHNAVLRSESKTGPSERSWGAAYNVTARLSSLLDYSKGTNINYQGSVVNDPLNQNYIESLYGYQ